METSGVREEQHLRGVCQGRFSSPPVSLSLCLSLLVTTRVKDLRSLAGGPWHLTFKSCSFFLGNSRSACAPSRSRSALLLCRSAGMGGGGLLAGLGPEESTDSGETFNPCPLPAPSPHSSRLYMDMFYFSLLPCRQLSRAKSSLFRGTYLGRGRNPLFLSNPTPSRCPPPAQFPLKR